LAARPTDAGGASRFFPAFRYQPKAGADERPRLEDGTAHSTVKPQELMNWLVRLVVPRGAVVLDPFAGTGTTGRACAIEGMNAILIEQDEKHCQLAVQKLSQPVQQALFGDLP
jgi:site-specific DNA-methyltransferase (adenine-specific)